uniref:G_PROTEIN_RECEP_F2_4 domain-containing protein n=1 Tax=Bursaphelenchus xylophilus TaxID=6326 RepID=A0A1I7S9I5_BURXY
MDQCLAALEKGGLPTFPHSDDGSLWCNATWDTVLCWPATPAGSTITLQCPPLKGLNPAKTITKICHSSGHWQGKTADDFSRPYGWTNFSMCFTQQVEDIMRMSNGSLVMAQEIAKNTRKLEFVGLGLSFISLLVSILILSSFSRLRVFRNMLHLQLMIAIMMMVIIRLVIYIDLQFTDISQPMADLGGKTINSMVFVCELAYFLLEYFKTVGFWWMFLEGFYLHNQLVFTVFNTEPKLLPYLVAGYGIPFLHTMLWLAVIVVRKQGKVERCLGNYYLEPDFWILDGPRMIQLVINTLFICNVIRVLWSKVRDSHSTSELDRMKWVKSVKAALMLIPLLGIPNIMQTIPFSPTQENMMYFAIWTYVASFTYMYQGFFISIIYCFTNREVIAVLKSCYRRFKLQHSTDLRRGSKSIASYYQVRNGTTRVSVTSKPDDSRDTKIKMISPRCNCQSTDTGTENGSTPLNFGFDENTPLKSCLRCDLDYDPYQDQTTKKTSVVTFLNGVG